MPNEIEHDVACRYCGYNLRTLLVNSVCPECGRPVAPSLSGTAERRFWASAGLVFLVSAGLELVRQYFVQDLEPDPSTMIFEGDWKGEIFLISASAIALSVRPRGPERLGQRLTRWSLRVCASAGVLLLLVDYWQIPGGRLLWWWPVIGCSAVAGVTPVPIAVRISAVLQRVPSPAAGQILMISWTASAMATLLVVFEIVHLLDWTVGLDLYLGHANAWVVHAARSAGFGLLALAGLAFTIPALRLVAQTWRTGGRAAFACR